VVDQNVGAREWLKSIFRTGKTVKLHEGETVGEERIRDSIGRAEVSRGR